jgi:hypothetical protein
MFTLDVSPNPARLTPASWFARLDSLTNAPGQLFAAIDTVTTAIVDRRNGLRYELFEGDESINYIYVPVGSLMYTITYQEATTEDDFLPYRDVFRTMLKSVRFSSARG